jgi:alpha-L-rhamnosidase
VNLPLHTPISLTVRAFFVDAARKTALTARLLGEDPSQWKAMAQQMRAALMERYFRDGGFGSQAGNVHGIALGILEREEDIRTAAAQLDRIIREEWDGHPNVGVAASRDIAMVLGRNGYPETARDIFLVEGYPGYLDNLTPPRTTVSSGWGPGIGRTVQSHGPAAGRWFTEGLAGIGPSEEGPGYRRFILAPEFPEGHPRASASLETAQGTIESAWQRNEDGSINWKVRGPWNSRAMVSLPGYTPGDVTCNGVPLKEATGGGKKHRGNPFL